MRQILACCVALFVAVLSFAGENDSPQRQIAVTFDDLPAGVVRETADMQEITTKILKVITDSRIPAIGFVNEVKLYSGDALDPDRVELLRRWLRAGLELGNHTFSHPDLHRISLEDFKRDTLRGEEMTRPLVMESGGSLRYFRHPFLHTGMDIAVKEQFGRFLADYGYRIAPVTIDNSEWIFNIAYRKASKEQRESVGREYVAYMEDMVEYYENQSLALFDREIRQILLLHANSINSEFLGDVIQMLKKRGYTFVSLGNALEDSAYELPDTFTGSGGISWIHRWAIARTFPKSFFQGEPTTPDWIQELAGIAE